MVYRALATPIGRLYIGADDKDALCYIGNKAPERGEAGESPILSHAAEQLTRYFEGSLREFSLPLAPVGTPFQQDVWRALRAVPYGITITYGELAARSGHPGAARAVGSAMAANPIAVVQPCHRVLPAGGRLGNYSLGGPANKEWLLLLERQNSGY